MLARPLDIRSDEVTPLLGARLPGAVDHDVHIEEMYKTTRKPAGRREEPNTRGGQLTNTKQRKGEASKGSFFLQGPDTDQVGGGVWRGV